MTVLKRIQLFLCLALALPLECPAQSTDVPVIGAQVFIEPGRTAGEIDNYFRILHDSGMKVARIRLFESHMRRAEGEWDYSLYDEAFLSAAISSTAYAKEHPDESMAVNVIGCQNLAQACCKSGLWRYHPIPDLTIIRSQGCKTYIVWPSLAITQGRGWAAN